MTPLDRQLDRLRDVPPAVPSGAPSPRRSGGHRAQAAPATTTPASHDTGAATSGCICGHSPVSHRRYRECTADGCVCWAYRKTTNNKSTPRPLQPGRGA